MGWCMHEVSQEILTTGRLPETRAGLGTRSNPVSGDLRIGPEFLMKDAESADRCR